MLSWIYAIVMLLVIASNLQTFAYYQEWMTPSGASAEPPLRRSRHTYAPRLEIRQWRHVAWWQHYRWLQSKYRGRPVELAASPRQTEHWRHVALADVLVREKRTVVMKRALAKLRPMRIATLPLPGMKLHVVASQESGPLHLFPIWRMRGQALLVDSAQLAELQRERLLVDLPKAQ